MEYLVYLHVLLRCAVVGARIGGFGDERNVYPTLFGRRWCNVFFTRILNVPAFGFRVNSVRTCFWALPYFLCRKKSRKFMPLSNLIKHEHLGNSKATHIVGDAQAF